MILWFLLILRWTTGVGLIICSNTCSSCPLWFIREKMSALIFSLGFQLSSLVKLYQLHHFYYFIIAVLMMYWFCTNIGNLECTRFWTGRSALLCSLLRQWQTTAPQSQPMQNMDHVQTWKCIKVCVVIVSGVGDGSMRHSKKH